MRCCNLGEPDAHGFFVSVVIDHTEQRDLRRLDTVIELHQDVMNLFADCPTSTARASPSDFACDIHKMLRHGRPVVSESEPSLERSGPRSVQSVLAA